MKNALKTVDTFDGWRCRAAPAGIHVYDVNGDKIGEMKALYYLDDTGLPEWMAIRSGFFGLRTSIAPMVRGSIRDGKLYLPYTKDQVKEAPKLARHGYSTTLRKGELFDHYGLERFVSEPRSDTRPTRTDLLEQVGDEHVAMTYIGDGGVSVSPRQPM